MSRPDHVNRLRRQLAADGRVKSSGAISPDESARGIRGVKEETAPMYFLIRSIIRYFKRRKQQGSPE